MLVSFMKLIYSFFLDVSTTVRWSLSTAFVVNKLNNKLFLFLNCLLELINYLGFAKWPYFRIAILLIVSAFVVVWIRS